MPVRSIRPELECLTYNWSFIQGYLWIWKIIYITVLLFLCVSPCIVICRSAGSPYAVPQCQFWFMLGPRASLTCETYIISFRLLTNVDIWRSLTCHFQGCVNVFGNVVAFWFRLCFCGLLISVRSEDLSFLSLNWSLVRGYVNVHIYITVLLFRRVSPRTMGCRSASSIHLLCWNDLWLDHTTFNVLSI